MGNANTDWNGPFYANVRTHHDIPSTGSSVGGGYLYMDASRSSTRYGNYTEVNPLYNSCKFLIRY